MHIHRIDIDDATMDYHAVQIDSLHDDIAHFGTIFMVTKQWMAVKGLPVWRPATISVKAVELLPAQVSLWLEGLGVAEIEAGLLDTKYPPGQPVTA